MKESDAIAKAEIPPTAHPMDLQTYMTLRVRSQERALEAKLRYWTYVDEHMAGLILLGDSDKQEAFAKLANKIGGTLSFDTNAIFREIVKSAFFMMGGQGSLTADQLA